MAAYSLDTVRRHFPTLVWLGRQLATALCSLVADAKRSFPPETALSLLELCLFPVMCPPSGVTGVVLVALAGALPVSYADLEICIRLGIQVGLIAVLPLALVLERRPAESWPFCSSGTLCSPPARRSQFGSSSPLPQRVDR